MTETDRLRDLLELAAPTDPDVVPRERSRVVARRGRAARTRDRVLVGAAAAAVVAAAVAVPLSLRGDDGPTVASAPEPVSCPATAIDVTATPDASLEDVESVRACPAVDETRPLPAGALVGEEAAAFVAEVRALPRYAMPDQCASMLMLAEPWAIVLGRADGGTVVLGSTLRACTVVSVDGVGRDPAAIIAAFEKHVSPTRDLSCPDGDLVTAGEPFTHGSFDPSATVAGVICYREDPMGSREYVRESGELSPEQLAVLRDDLLTRSGHNPHGNCTDTGPQRLLLLADATGDQAAYLDVRCAHEFMGFGGVWRPSDAAEEVIAQALGGRA